METDVRHYWIISFPYTYVTLLETYRRSFGFSLGVVASLVHRVDNNLVTLVTGHSAASAYAFISPLKKHTFGARGPACLL